MTSSRSDRATVVSGVAFPTKNRIEIEQETLYPHWLEGESSLASYHFEHPGHRPADRNERGLSC